MFFKALTGLEPEVGAQYPSELSDENRAEFKSALADIATVAHTIWNISLTANGWTRRRACLRRCWSPPSSTPGAFRAVVLTPSVAAGDLRLDTEIIRQQHEFGTQPGLVRFTLRAYLVDDKTRRVLAWREFDTAVPAPSTAPYGGVIAANRAVQTVLENLSAFYAEAARSARMEK